MAAGRIAYRCFGAEETAALLSYPELIVQLQRAWLEVADGKIQCPTRMVTPLADAGVLLSMPAVGADLASHKLVAVVPNNRRLGREVVTGTLSVLEVATGECLAILDGATVTGWRTAAMSLLGIRMLAADRVHHALIIGTGIQALYHVQAIAALHPEARIAIRGRSIEAAADFCASRQNMHGSLEPAAAQDDWDVVVACTTSAVPVYLDAAQIGRLVIAVGAFSADAAEIAPDTVRASELWVDNLAGAQHEAGDLIQADVAWDSVRSIADALRAPAEFVVPAIGMQARAQRPRLFKTVGCAAWDLACARVAVAHLGRSAPA